MRDRLIGICPICNARITFRWLENRVRETVRPYAHKTEGGWCSASSQVYSPNEITT